MKSSFKIYILFCLIGSVLFCQSSNARQLPNIARAMFTTGIVDREPVDQILVLNNKQNNVFFFTDLRHFDGQTITHKWIYNDKVESVVEFKVKGPRWRIFSKKEIKPQQIGKWTVIIQDESGKAVKASVFRFVDESAQQIILPLSDQK